MCNSGPTLYLGFIGGIMGVRIKTCRIRWRQDKEAVLQPCPFSLVCMNGGGTSGSTDTYSIRYEDDDAFCDFSVRC